MSGQEYRGPLAGDRTTRLMYLGGALLLPLTALLLALLGPPDRPDLWLGVALAGLASAWVLSFVACVIADRWARAMGTVERDVAREVTLLALARTAITLAAVTVALARGAALGPELPAAALFVMGVFTGTRAAFWLVEREDHASGIQALMVAPLGAGISFSAAHQVLAPPDATVAELTLLLCGVFLAAPALGAAVVIAALELWTRSREAKRQAVA